MKKLAAVILSVAILTGCITQVANPQYAKPLAVSYQITDKEGRGYCSAVKVGYETLITAAHCLQKEDDLYIKTHSGDLVKAFVIRKDEANDLGLIEAAVYGPNALIARERPQAGDDALIIGFPTGVGPVLTIGLWAGGSFEYDDGENKHTFNIATAPVAGGNSGGGAFVRLSDGQWYLAGVLQAVPLQGFMTPINHMALVSYFPFFKAFIKK